MDFVSEKTGKEVRLLSNPIELHDIGGWGCVLAVY